jgi:3-keto-5-aminohexanoate cleavage enzyme
MAEEARRLFPHAPWEVNATGKDQFPMNILGASMDCDIVRVGFEDNVYLPNGKRARNNFEMVEAMVTIAESLGRRIATVEEARQILSGAGGKRASTAPALH